MVSALVVLFRFSNDIVILNPVWYFREYLFVNGYLYKMFNFRMGPAHANPLETAKAEDSVSSDGNLKVVDA